MIEGIDDEGKTECTYPPCRRGRLPRLNRLADVTRELAWLYRSAHRGDLPWQDATRAAFILAQLARLAEQSEIAARLDELEDRMAPGAQGRPLLRRIA